MQVDLRFDRLKKERDRPTRFNLSRGGFSKFSGIVIPGSSSDPQVAKPKSRDDLLKPLLFILS